MKNEHGRVGRKENSEINWWRCIMPGNGVGVRLWGWTDLALFVLAVTALWVGLTSYPRKTNLQETTPEAVAAVYNENGTAFVVTKNDLVRVTHKDRNVRSLTPLQPGLYKIRDIKTDAGNTILWFEDPRSPDPIQCDTDILWAQREYVLLQLHTKDCPEYEKVRSEFAQIASASSGATASTK